MDTEYYIQLSLKTPGGPESFAKFFVGDDKKKAYAIFGKLTGTPDVNEKDIMFIDFMETRKGLPLSVDMITCTLDQLGENCKTITRELFKLNTFSVV